MILYLSQPYTRPSKRVWQRRIFLDQLFILSLSGYAEPVGLTRYERYRVRLCVRLYRERRKMYCLRSKARLIRKKCFEKNK